MPSDLRQRRHRETRAELIIAGLALFEEHGYDAVTMEQIAASAGVSRRTLYRHFPTKDRILLDLPTEWLARWDELVAQLPPDTPPWDVLEQALRTIGAQLDADGDRIRTAWRIIDSIPSLEPAFLANPIWTGRVVAVLTDAARGTPPEAAAAHALAGAYLGAIDASMFRWASQPPAGPGATTVAEVVEAVIDTLAPLWPERRRRRR